LTRLVLVRHGESEWNHSGRYQGQLDTNLSELGRSQAARLAARVENERLDGILSSPLRRAMETASMIAYWHSSCVQVEPGLIEMDHGKWSGLLASQVAAEYGEALSLWQTEPARVQMPDGESIADVGERVWPVVEGLLSNSSESTYLICSHDVPLRLIILRALGLDYAHFWRPRLDNASLTLVQFGTQGAAVVLANDTEHLGEARSALEGQAL